MTSKRPVQIDPPPEHLVRSKAIFDRYMAGDAFTEAVEADEYEAQQIGVRGVPFFVLDDRYAVSGAQASEHFLSALNQTWQERQAV